MTTSKVHFNIEKPKIEETYTNLSNTQNGYRQSEKQETKTIDKEKNLILGFPLFSYSTNSTNQKTQENIKDKLFLQHKRKNSQKSHKLLICHQCRKMDFFDNCLICYNCKNICCKSCIKKNYVR